LYFYALRNQKEIALDTNSITPEVVRTFNFKDERVAVLIGGLIQHLHDYAREVKLTHDEWRAGLNFLTASGRITDDARNEFCLISDILGLSSLVDLLHTSPEATPGSVLGPFHVHDSRWRDNGVDLVEGQAGQLTLFHGRVLSVQGEPLQAELDFWQNADNGMYPQQDLEQDPHNLRCKLRTNKDGYFSVRTVRPQPYGVPEDGPVGELLALGGRSCMRPAHLHAIVQADGYKPVVTEIFPMDDPYLESDAVFGVRPALRVPFVLREDPEAIRTHKMAGPFLEVNFDFHLQRIAR
jgi:protocatechuate 3,4-dioxygenase beta subunit